MSETSGVINEGAAEVFPEELTVVPVTRNQKGGREIPLQSVVSEILDQADMLLLVAFASLVKKPGVADPTKILEFLQEVPIHTIVLANAPLKDWSRTFVRNSALHRLFRPGVATVQYFNYMISGKGRLMPNSFVFINKGVINAQSYSRQDYSHSLDMIKSVIRDQLRLEASQGTGPPRPESRAAL